MSEVRYLTLSPHRAATLIRVVRDENDQPVLDENNEAVVLVFERRVVHCVKGKQLDAVRGDIGNALVEVDENDFEASMRRMGELLNLDRLSDETVANLEQIGAIVNDDKTTKKSKKKSPAKPKPEPVETNEPESDESSPGEEKEPADQA